MILGLRDFLNTKRGMTMVIAMIIVAILLAIAVAVLGETITAATDAGQVQNKSNSYNAADGALAAAMKLLDTNPKAGTTAQTCVSDPPKLNGMSWTGCVVSNTFGQALGTTPTDPATGLTVNLPTLSNSGYAFVYGKVAFGAGQGARQTYAEGFAAPQTLKAFNYTGINGEHAIVDDYNGKAVVAGDVRANDAVYQANGAAQPVTGYSGGYNFDNLPGAGNPSTHTRTSGGMTLQTFPSPTQMNLYKASALEAAQAGVTLTPAQALTTCTAAAPCGGAANGTVPGNLYINGDITLTNQDLYFSGGSVVYINGNVNLSGSTGGGINNQANNIVVITGSITITGNAAFNNPSNKGVLVIYGTDSGQCAVAYVYPAGNANPTGCAADFGGNALPAGLVYTPYGSINLRGNGNQTGSFDSGTTPDQSGGYVYLNGGGSGGGFTSSPAALLNPPTGLWHIVAYWEY
jgi:type II secretory pathway pseudopilin PulG